MEIEKLVVGQLDTNCYLVWCKKTKEALIIDPGDEGNYVSEKILAKNLKPKAIVATHGHFDHVLAVTELKLAFNIPFYLNQKDQPFLDRIEKTTEHFAHFRSDPPPKVDVFLKDKDTIHFGNQTLQVIETPGHTPGGISLYSKGVLFSGDTLFARGVGRTDFSYSSDKDLKASVKKLLKLPPETEVYPGHGPQTTIEEEKKFFSAKGKE